MSGSAISRYFAIVPAAGRSQRMGQPKLLLPWKGETILETVIGAWKAGGASEVVVVANHQDSELIEVATAANANVVTPNPAPPEMKCSVAAGLNFVESTFAPTDDDAWMLAPADMPLLSANVIKRIIAGHSSTRPSVIAPVVTQADGTKKRGHPVLFPWRLSQQVYQLGTDEGVKALLERNTVVEIELSEKASFRDVDTPEQYAELFNHEHVGDKKSDV